LTLRVQGAGFIPRSLLHMTAATDPKSEIKLLGSLETDYLEATL